MNRIVVAIDGSEDASRALEYAGRLEEDRGADLVVVNVVGGYGLPDDIFASFTRSRHEWLEEALRSRSADILDKARNRARQLGVKNVHLDSRSGDIAQAILDVAAEKQADTVVAGKRGTSRVSGLLIGSVSQKLVSLAKVPVTIVP